MHGHRIGLGLISLLAGALCVAGGEVKPVETFDAGRIGPPNAGAVSHWKWSGEDKRNAHNLSRLEIREGEGAKGRALAVSIPEPLPRAADLFTLWTTSLDYLPPETVAVRMRLRVAGGRFTLTVGSATAYFANSDVWARPQVLEPGGWQTVEFSLVADLQRNFRRAVFSAESPAIHYTRWIQEPMRIMIGSDSHGELWIDDIELVVSEREGASTKCPENEIRVLSAADLGRAFTFSTDDKEFDLARTPGKAALRKPAILKLPGGRGGALGATQRGLEEMSFFGFPISCPEGTNAFRIAFKMEHPSRFAELVVDFLALVSTDASFAGGRPTPGGSEGFDFCLSPERTKGLSWGFYHARRMVPNGERVTLVIPFADFVCGYGSGELRGRHQLQQPLDAGIVTALAMVSPFRQAGADTSFNIEFIEAVRLED